MSEVAEPPEINPERIDDKKFSAPANMADVAVLISALRSTTLAHASAIEALINNDPTRARKAIATANNALTLAMAFVEKQIYTDAKK